MTSLDRTYFEVLPSIITSITTKSMCSPLASNIVDFTGKKEIFLKTF